MVGVSVGPLNHNSTLPLFEEIGKLTFSYVLKTKFLCLNSDPPDTLECEVAATFMSLLIPASQVMQVYLW